MNKEVKELIEDIKKREYKVIYKKDYDLLLDYINQLERKISKVVKYAETYLTNEEEKHIKKIIK